MAEYIEREKLIEKLNEAPAYFDSGDIRYGIDIAIQQVIEQPTADVVEVVRCGQCGNYCKNTGECNLYGRHPNENDFCSSGKKEHEDNGN